MASPASPPEEEATSPMSRRLSLLGRSTLVTETHTNLSVTVFVVVLESQITEAEVHDIARERLLRQHPRYRSLVGGDMTFVELPIDEIDLKQHVRVHELADPTSREELHGLLGLYSGLPISHAKPLWEIILVPRLRSGSALVFRQHHCMADGSGGAMVMDSISDSPEQWRSQPRPPWPMRWLAALATLCTLLISVPFVIYSVTLTMLFRDRPGPLKPAKLQGGRRKVAVSEPLALARLRRASRAAGCKINDLALALFSLALREQARRAGAAAATGPVWAGIPIDVRVPGEVYFGNKFGFGVCRLPLHLADFGAVVRYVQHKMSFVKEHHIAPVMYYFSVLSSFVLPPAVLRILLHSTSGNISLVISNVAGGSKQLVFKGHAAEYVYGLVPPPPTVGIGCAIISQRDKVVFSMVADGACEVDPAEVISHLTTTLEALDPGH